MPIIIDALNDTEGHDWTVRERAIRVIGNYDSFVVNYEASVIPTLKAIRKQFKEEQGWIESDYR